MKYISIAIIIIIASVVIIQHQPCTTFDASQNYIGHTCGSETYYTQK